MSRTNYIFTRLFGSQQHHRVERKEQGAISGEREARNREQGASRFRRSGSLTHFPTLYVPPRELLKRNGVSGPGCATAAEICTAGTQREYLPQRHRGRNARQLKNEDLANLLCALCVSVVDRFLYYVISPVPLDTGWSG